MKTTVEKIEYLRRLLQVSLVYSRHYTKISVIVSSKDFMVIWSDPRDNYYSFEAIEVPLEDLDKRIEHYKNKLRYNFKKRNNNKKLN